MVNLVPDGETCVGEDGETRKVGITQRTDAIYDSLLALKLYMPANSIMGLQILS